MKALKYFLWFPFIVMGIVLLLAFFFPTVSIEEQYEIDAPVQKTWDIFHDNTFMKQWLTGFKRMKAIEEKPGKIGSRYQMFFDEGDGEMYMIEEITGYKAYEQFDFKMEHPAANTKTNIRFEEKDGKTIIYQQVETEANSFFFRSMLPFMQLSMKKQNAESYGKLKALVESLED